MHLYSEEFNLKEILENHEDRIQKNEASLGKLEKDLKELKKARKSNEKLTKLLIKELQESTLILD